MRSSMRGPLESFTRGISHPRLHFIQSMKVLIQGHYEVGRYGEHGWKEEGNARRCALYFVKSVRLAPNVRRVRTGLRARPLSPLRSFTKDSRDISEGLHVSSNLTVSVYWLHL